MAFAQVAPSAVEWTPNRLRKTSVVRGIVFLAIGAFNLFVIYIYFAAGRFPSPIYLVLTPLFLTQGALAFLQRRRIPIATGTSWDAIHFDIPDGREAHPIGGIAKTKGRFSLNAGLTFQINGVDGSVVKYCGVSAIRARELTQFVERRKTELAAIAAGAPPLMYAAVPSQGFGAPWPAAPQVAAQGAYLGAPLPAAFGYPTAPLARPGDTGPSAAWNASLLSSGASIPDQTVSQARTSMAQHTGLWLSADTAMLKRQAKGISVVLIIFPVLMVLQIGVRGRYDTGLLIGIGLAIGVVLVVLVQFAMRKSLRGEEGATFMMLPPTLTSAMAVEAVVSHAAVQAGLQAGAPSRKKMERSWQLNPTMTLKANQGPDGQIRNLTLRSKGTANVEAHKRFKGAILEALGAPSGPPPPMMMAPPPLPPPPPAPPAGNP